MIIKIEGMKGIIQNLDHNQKTDIVLAIDMIIVGRVHIINQNNPKKNPVLHLLKNKNLIKFLSKTTMKK